MNKPNSLPFFGEHCVVIFIFATRYNFTIHLNSYVLASNAWLTCSWQVICRKLALRFVLFRNLWYFYKRYSAILYIRGHVARRGETHSEAQHLHSVGNFSTKPTFFCLLLLEFVTFKLDLRDFSFESIKILQLKFGVSAAKLSNQVIALAK